MNIDYANLDRDLENGEFRRQLKEELTIGFRIMRDAGDRLPPSSHYASQIAEIVSRGSAETIDPELAFYLYQEILSACEAARETVTEE